MHSFRTGLSISQYMFHDSSQNSFLTNMENPLCKPLNESKAPFSYRLPWGEPLGMWNPQNDQVAEHITLSLSRPGIQTLNTSQGTCRRRPTNHTGRYKLS